PPPPCPPPWEATLAPVPGAGFGLFDDAGFGATRRVPDPSSKVGLLRVRFWSVGGLTSIGGNCSVDAVCCACAPEIPSAASGARKLEASRKRRRRLSAVIGKDMVRTSV